MNVPETKICVVGLGYVGLCLAAGLANKGYPVTCVDIDKEKIAMVASGKSPIYEPGLDELLAEGVQAGRIVASTDLVSGVLDSDIIFICVGTPCNEAGYIDLSHVRAAAQTIGLALHNKAGYPVVSVKSTVIPGTTDGVVKPLLEQYSGKRAGKDFGLAMTPEFLREGSAIQDMMVPDKTVIGSIDEKSRKILTRLFSVFPGPQVTCDLRTAEMIKYANNAFLATKISFINEIANLCEKFGADSAIVAHAIGLDARIGPKFLMAGCGFGGSCFPKDVKALYSAGKQAGYESKILKATLDVNEHQPMRVVEAVNKLLGAIKGKKIAVLGLSFKPDTDDMRDAPAIKIINGLLACGASVVAYDPAAISNAKRLFGTKITFASSTPDALATADAAIIVTEWAQFRQLTPSDFKKAMKIPVIVDGRKIYNPKEMQSAGIKYFQIGYSDDQTFVPK